MLVYRPLKDMGMLFKQGWPIWPLRCHQSSWPKWTLLPAGLAPSWRWQMSILKRTQLRGPGASSTPTPPEGSILSVTVHAHLPVASFLAGYCYAHVGVRHLGCWTALFVLAVHAGHGMMNVGRMMMHVGGCMLII